MSSEFDEIQYREGIATYREQYRLLVQILYLFFLSDVTLLGFAVQSQSLPLTLFTLIFPFAMFLARRAVRSRMIPIIYECVRYEIRTGTKFGLMSKYHRLAEEKELVRLAIANADNSDDVATLRAYRKINGSMILHLAKSTLLGGTGLYLLFHLAVLAAFIWKDAISHIIPQILAS